MLGLFFAVFIAFGLLLLILYLRGDPYLYIANEHGIIIKYTASFLPQNLYFINYKKISSLELISMARANLLIFFPYIRVGFKWWGKQAVLIHLNYGFIRIRIIAPPNPENFINTIKEKILLHPS